MYSLFTVLFLLSLVLLIWGLIAPHHFAKHAKNQQFSRKHAGLGFGLLFVVFLVLAGITAPPQKQQPTTLNVTSAKSQIQPKVKADSVVTKQVTETQSVAYTTSTQDDNSLPKGQTAILQTGKNGSETLTYTVTYTNGVQTSKTLTNTTITTQPVNEIIANGTYVAPAPTPTPGPSPTPSPSCQPLTNGGNCYEPGEYCRNSDHGVIGVAGDGKSIVCTYNDGWRWEPL